MGAETRGLTRLKQVCVRAVTAQKNSLHSRESGGGREDYFLSVVGGEVVCGYHFFMYNPRDFAYTWPFFDSLYSALLS